MGEHQDLVLHCDHLDHQHLQILPPVTQSMQLSTNQEDIHVHIQSLNQFNSPYSYMSVASPQSYEVHVYIASISGLVILVFVMVAGINLIRVLNHQMICVCNTRSGASIQHVIPQYSIYTVYVPESRFGNAYYYASPHCIQACWPMFFPGSLHMMF